MGLSSLAIASTGTHALANWVLSHRFSIRLLQNYPLNTKMPYTYSRILEAKQDGFEKETKSSQRLDSFRKLPLVLVLCLCTGFGGYLAGHRTIDTSKHTSPLAGVLDGECC